MKKVLPIFIIALIATLFTSCNHRVKYDLLNPVEDISEISIVALTFDAEGAIEQTVVQEIENTGDFINDFRKLHCYMNYGGPMGATPEGVEDTVIRISYENEEYELINWTGQTKYTLERDFRYYAG